VLSFAQQRLWFLDQLAPGNISYNSPSVIRLVGLLNVVALAQSLAEIIRRHEVLRTTFVISKGQPVQIIGPPPSLGIPLIALEALDEPKREAETQRLAIQEARWPFNLAQGPLLRATLLRLEAEEHALLLTTHHIIWDGWSIGLFFRELAILFMII